MAESSASQNGEVPAPIAAATTSDREAFASTRRAVRDLEAIGVSEFQFFNALADLYHQRREPEISALMAEAAYKIFQKEA